MNEMMDVAVVGAGPAGLAVAIGAAQRGMRVRVVDVARDGPVDKACGEGLLPYALECLGRLGVRVGAGRRMAGIRFMDGRRVAEARFSGRAGLGVRRTELHRMLLERAEELGVAVEWGVRLRVMDEVGSGIVVGADGGQSRVRVWAGLEEGRVTTRRVGLRQHFGVAPWSEFVEVYWGDGVQAYVTPVGEREVGVALVSGRRLGSMAEGLECFPELRKRLGAAGATSVARGAVTVTRQLRRVSAGRVALVGDASGGVDAITGEGMSLCFRQAEALVEAMACGDLAGYEGAHRGVMRMARGMSWALMQMDGSAIVRWGAMVALSGIPGVFERLLGLHVGAAGSAVRSGRFTLGLKQTQIAFGNDNQKSKGRFDNQEREGRDIRGCRSAEG